MVSPRKNVDDFLSLGLGEEVERKILWDNAARLFRVSHCYHRRACRICRLKPMGRLDAFDVGPKKLTVQTEFFSRPNWRIETKVYLAGALKKVYTEDLSAHAGERAAADHRCLSPGEDRRDRGRLAQTPAMNGIRVEALTKAYRPFGAVRPVLKGIDLTIAPGEVVGLIGPNGAGKTTLMSCIVGFLNADTGSITIDGRSNDDLDVRRRTGFVPERMNFDRRANGGAFLRYMARLAGVPRDRVRDARRRAARRASAWPTPRTSGSRNTRAACCSASAWPRR